MMTKKELYTKCKELGLDVKTRMTKGEIEGLLKKWEASEKRKGAKAKGIAKKKKEDHRVEKRVSPSKVVEEAGMLLDETQVSDRIETKGLRANTLGGKKEYERFKYVMEIKKKMAKMRKAFVHIISDRFGEFYIKRRGNKFEIKDNIL